MKFNEVMETIHPSSRLIVMDCNTELFRGFATGVTYSHALEEYRGYEVKNVGLFTDIYRREIVREIAYSYEVRHEDVKDVSNYSFSDLGVDIYIRIEIKKPA